MVMNQAEALAAAQKMLPEISDNLRLARTHSIGMKFGHNDEFTVWSHVNGGCEILAHSDHSWEHALSLINAERIAHYTPADHSDIDAEIENQSLGAF
jgi:hypothetical protein